MSQEGMDQHWAEMSPAGRLRTIRNEVIVGHFESAREKWLSRLVFSEPGIVAITGEILRAERHQANAIRLLQHMEDEADE